MSGRRVASGPAEGRGAALEGTAAAADRDAAPPASPMDMSDHFESLLDSGPTPDQVIDGADVERSLVRMTKAQRKRRSVPVIGFVGTSGHGKSSSAVRDLLPSLARGIPVMSTTPLYDAHTGNLHPLYVPFYTFQQLDDARGVEVLFDEVTQVMDSNEGSMPKRVRRLLPQMRRRGNRVTWTGIDWDNANRRLRQMTQAVTMCRGYMPDLAAVNAAKKDPYADIPMWSPNRLFFLVTRDAQLMMRSEDSQRISGDVSQRKGSRRRPKALVREFWYGPGSDAWSSYRTLGDVNAVDNVCMVCGLREAAEGACKGHPDEDVLAAGHDHRVRFE